MPARVLIAVPGNDLKLIASGSEIRWLKRAPVGTPAPYFARLGLWLWNEGSRPCGQSGFCGTTSP